MTAPPLAIVNARLWDGTGADPVPATTIIVREGRIAAAGRELEPPANVTVVNAGGRFVMPGLIDMHVHVQLCGEDSLFAFLGAGLTSVRDLGSDIDRSLPMRNAIETGERIGPNLFVYGPLLDGDPPIFPPQRNGLLPTVSRVSTTIDEAVGAVDELIDRGVDGLKLYAGLRPPFVEAMIERAGGRVPVTGHLGRTWASEAIRAGINGLEHVHATIYQDIARPEDRHGREDGNGSKPNYWTWLTTGWANADLDALYVGEFIDLLVERKIVLSPTTVLITGGMATTEAADEPGQRYRPRFMVERTRERQQQMQRLREEAERAGNPLPEPQPVDPELGQRARANEIEFLRRVHEAGGHVVPSTDVGAAPMQVPGFSLHRELALLVEGGIPAGDVLRMATSGAASALRRSEDLGTIEPGKRADLLILDGDPLVNISNTRRIGTVIKAGVAWEPGDLLGRIET